MFILLWDFALCILVGVPFSLFFLYLAATIFQDLIGGPVWLWFVILLIGGIFSSVGKFNEKLRQVKEQNQI